MISRGAYPVGINYYGFPRGLCASPNEVALHGVPNTRPLEEGDPEDESDMIGGNVLD